MRFRVSSTVQCLSALSETEQLATLLHASQARPNDGELHAAIASLLSDSGRFNEAVGAALIATRQSPQSARAQAELGRSLFLAGNAAAALEPCARAVTLAPHNLGAVVTFGAVLFTLGRLQAALQAATEAVVMDPSHFQARANLALALEGLGRLDEAEAQSRRALALNPSSAAARHNLAGLRLSRGKLDAESWHLYGSRLDLTPQARRLSAVPRWAGEDVAGRTMLLHAEQGFGDVIQFARYAPLVESRGARVVLAVPEALVRLLTGMRGVAQVVDVRDLPDFDVFCPLASLPGVFDTTLMTIPSQVPYLRAACSFIRTETRLHEGLEVGLVWAGNPGFVHDRFRSMEGALLAPLAGLPGVRFHTLQKDQVAPFPMIDHMGAVKDFADTAALIAGLDLVITVDTAVAHLAGAMGKPVWMMSRFMGCWRWLRDRDDSPWYPTMRIFRQPTPGDWSSVVADIRTALLARTGLKAA